MYSTLISIIFFLVKVVLIEWAIEACRWIFYVIAKNAFPEKVFITHKNRILHWIINGLETAAVVLLLYFNYPIPFIIGFILCFTYMVKTVGERLIVTRLLW